jgi:uracil DNA glycosylase
VGHPTPLPEGAAGSSRQARLGSGALERDTRQKIAMLNADLATTRQRLREAGASEGWERLLCAPVEALLEELAGEELLR